MRQPVFPILLFLAGLVACKPPVPPGNAREAALEAAARSESTSVPADRKADFIQGFRMGARMVWEAARRHQTPWQPVLGTPPPPPLPGAARALGVRVEPPRLDVEVDADTGFPRSVLDPAEGGFNPGEVAGFAWALAPLRNELIHPGHLPAPPAPGSWEAWNPSGLQLMAAGAPGLRVQASWTGNLLAWSWVERGFPPRRTWRSFDPGVVPEAMALQDRCLWIATKGQGTVALDLESGFIVRLDPHGPDLSALHDPSGDEKAWKARLAQEEAADRRQRPVWMDRARRGDAKAMLSLAFSAGSPEEAASWFRQAAEAGDRDGMYEWAIRLYQGRGVPENRGEARRWFEKAARAGHPQAAEVLKGLYKES